MKIEVVKANGEKAVLEGALVADAQGRTTFSTDDCVDGCDWLEEPAFTLEGDKVTLAGKVDDGLHGATYELVLEGTIVADGCSSVTIQTAAQVTLKEAGEYFRSVMRQRTEDAIGSHFPGIRPTELQEFILLGSSTGLGEANWLEVRHPAVSSPCRAFRTQVQAPSIHGVRELRENDLVLLADPKKTGFRQSHIIVEAHELAPAMTDLWLITGPSRETGREMMYTCHPGAPAASSQDTSTMVETLDGKTALDRGIAIGKMICRDEAQEICRACGAAEEALAA